MYLITHKVALLNLISSINSTNKSNLPQKKLKYSVFFFIIAMIRYIQIFLNVRVIILTMELDTRNNLAKIIRMFKQYECEQQTLISKHKLTQILNKQAVINDQHLFSPNIIEQMWGQAETTSRGESTVLTFSKIYAQAMAILQDRIRIIDGSTGIKQKKEQLKVEMDKLKELESQYDKGYEPNFDRINILKKNIVALQNKVKEVSKNREDFEKQLILMEKCLTVEQRPFLDRTEIITQRMDQSTSAPSPSPSLLAIFYATAFAIILQMLLLNFHQSFLAILCYFFVVFWLFIGYYDQYFINTLILGLVASSLLDIAYVILQLVGRIALNRYQTDQKTWNYISMVVMILEVAIRLFVIIKLCPFREIQKKRQYFVLFGAEIELNRRSGKMFSSSSKHIHNR